ncbi:MAG TPA: hypothetical protein VGO09_04645 [Flavisolibacter sp.]|nr:hypothetical protein [Flavisolibacter sp.]
MERVTLIFESIEKLKEFEKVCKANYVVMNLKNKTYACECSRADIELAINSFGAKVAEHGNIFK